MTSVHLTSKSPSNHPATPSRVLTPFRASADDNKQTKRFTCRTVNTVTQVSVFETRKTDKSERSDVSEEGLTKRKQRRQWHQVLNAFVGDEK